MRVFGDGSREARDPVDPAVHNGDGDRAGGAVFEIGERFDRLDPSIRAGHFLDGHVGKNDGVVLEVLGGGWVADEVADLLFGHADLELAPIPLLGLRRVARKDFDQSISVRPWDEVIVVATAAGYGLSVPALRLGKRIKPGDWTLQLVKDVPITGRILDLQGKLVAGVAVRVHGFFRPTKGNLTAWLRDLKEKKEADPALRTHLFELSGAWMDRDVGRLFPVARTGADGRFRLSGVGRERLVGLQLEGPSLVNTELFAMTRPGDRIRAARWRRGEGGDEATFYGSAFDHVAIPCRPIIGVVRDKDTGKPLPGATVQSYLFARSNYGGHTSARAVADKAGCYRLTGLPKGQGNVIRAAGPNGQPYLMALAAAAASLLIASHPTQTFNHGLHG